MSDHSRQLKKQEIPQIRLRKVKTRKQSPSSNSNRGNSSDISQNTPNRSQKHSNNLQRHSNSSSKNFRLRSDANSRQSRHRRRNISEGNRNPTLTRSNSSKKNLPNLDPKQALINKIKDSFKVTGLPPITSSSFYSLNKKLGKGAFGKVYSATHLLTGLPVAIKTIDKSYFKSERSKLKVFQEVHVMRKIHHSNVVRLLEIFETSRFFMIVLEYADNGDLLQLLKQKIRIAEEEAKGIFAQIVQGLMACHSRNVVHRDIKLDNILLTTRMQAKICDFGVSRSVKPDQVINDQCGTPAYLAPEIIINRGYVGFYVDIWSLGILLYAMLCGTVPFKSDTLNGLHKAILMGTYTIPDYVSSEATDLIKRMVCPVPFQRIPLQEVLKHEWLSTCNTRNKVDEEPSKKKKLILNIIEEYGYPSDYVEQSLRIRDVNHATATYHLLDMRYSSLN